jgi:hypothetical protein
VGAGSREAPPDRVPVPVLRRVARGASEETRDRASREESEEGVNNPTQYVTDFLLPDGTQVVVRCQGEKLVTLPMLIRIEKIAAEATLQIAHILGGEE